MFYVITHRKQKINYPGGFFIDVIYDIIYIWNKYKCIVQKTYKKLNQLYIILTLGPYGEQDDQQVFIQKVVPETDKLFVRLSSNGQRYVVIVISYYSNN